VHKLRTVRYKKFQSFGRFSDRGNVLFDFDALHFPGAHFLSIRSLPKVLADFDINFVQRMETIRAPKTGNGIAMFFSKIQFDWE